MAHAFLHVSWVRQGGAGHKQGWFSVDGYLKAQTKRHFYVNTVPTVRAMSLYDITAITLYD